MIALGVFLGGAPASAAPASAAPASATPASAGPSAPPAAQAPAAKLTIAVDDSASAAGRASGTGAAGDSLRVLDPLHPASSLCTTVVASDGSWSCPVALTSGANQKLTVRDTTDTSLADVPSAPFSVLTEPVITSPSGIAVGAGVSGTGFAGATVTLSVSGTGSTSGTTATVPATVSSGGAWRAILPASSVPSGAYSVSAVQRSTAVPAVPVSGASKSVSIVVDRTAPSAPVVLSPTAGSTVRAQPFTFRGTGETGATVTTYIDSNPVCTAVVRSGRWSCSTAGLLIPAGTFTVQAGQRDVAGDYGPASPVAKVTFASAATSTPSPPPTSGQPNPSQPSTPQPSHSSGSAAPPSSGGTGGSGGSDGSASGGSGGGSAGSGGAGGSSGSGSGGSAGQAGGGSPGGVSSLESAAAASWTAPTGFGHDLPTLSQGVSGTAWLWALIIGLAFALLVIAPIRLAATALSGRLALRARRLTGRNRVGADRDDSPLLPKPVAFAATVVGGAVLVALGFGVDDQLRYVRLVFAIALGLVAVNGLGIVLPTLVLGRRLGLRLRFGVSGRLLVVAAVACVITRVFDLDPPLVLGVLVVAGLVDNAGRALDEIGDVRRGGILATVQLGSLALVSFAAWVGHGLLPASSGSFGVEVVRESLATGALAGLGSLIVLLLPLGRLPGRALWSWSKSTLIGVGIVGAALATVVYAASPGEAFPVLPLVVVGVVFAVASVTAWVWVRYVEPGVDDLV